ncbi:MAG: universal stress protein [Candidatus Obscuribacterales bacterium]|jgi:nucleotide-binding universal stress UspA family protein|nr:universal stress protein [Candidatus Obscuribacterales bacterium]
MVVQQVKDDAKVIDIADARAVRYIIAIKSERDIDQLTLWLASRTYLRKMHLSLVHVVKPGWLDRDPDSGLAGARMLSQMELNTVKNLAMLENGASILREQFPHVEVDYWIKVGDPIEVLPEIARTISADAMLVFGCSGDDRPFWDRSFSQLVANKCPCPLECFSPRN